MVGGDGLIYEGRGWNKEGAHTKGYNIYSICIAFIGTFAKYTPSKKQQQITTKLIEQGIILKKISQNYKLYWQNQLDLTSSRSSPKLYEIIKEWNHFSNETPEID